MLPSASLAAAATVMLLPAAKMAPATGALMLALGARLACFGAACTSNASRTSAAAATKDRICLRVMFLEPAPRGTGQTGASVRIARRGDRGRGHKARDRRSGRAGPV